MIDEAMAVTDAELLDAVDDRFRHNDESAANRFCGGIGSGTVT